MLKLCIIIIVNYIVPLKAKYIYMTVKLYIIFITNKNLFAIQKIVKFDFESVVIPMKSTFFEVKPE